MEDVLSHTDFEEEVKRICDEHAYMRLNNDQDIWLTQKPSRKRPYEFFTRKYVTEYFWR